MMKKLMMILLTMIMISSMTITAAASDFSTSISGPGSIDAGATFSVDINVNSGKELLGVRGGFTFDKDKLELVSSEGKNGFALTVGGNIVADATSGKSGSFTVGTITFKAKSGFAQGDSTTISLTGVEGSDGASTLSGSNASKSLSVKVPPKPKSTNSNLASLAVNPGSINFSKNTTTYNMIVNNSVSSMTIQASAEDSKAKVSGAGSKSLSVYGNRFNITVTAENGNTKTYTINVTRRDTHGNTTPLSGNANLSALSIEGQSMEFSSDVTAYSLKVGNHISSLSLTAAADHSAAKVDVNKPEMLEPGSNKITITVTAENGSTKVYTIDVERDDSASVLSMEELEDAMRNMTVKEVIVLQCETGMIDEEVLKILREKGMTLMIRAQDEDGNILYEWIIEGETLEEELKAIRTLMSFGSENQETIFQAANFAQGLILSFEHNEFLPDGTKVRINVSDHYSAGDSVNLYYYRNGDGKLEEKATLIVDDEGFVTLSLDHTSEYFLTRAVVMDLEEEEVEKETEDEEILVEEPKERNSSLFIYLSGLQFFAILGLAGYIWQLKRKR